MRGTQKLFRDRFRDGCGLWHTNDVAFHLYELVQTGVLLLQGNEDGVGRDVLLILHCSHTKQMGNRHFPFFLHCFLSQKKTKIQFSSNALRNQADARRQVG